jgi:hypothetical protein
MIPSFLCYHYTVALSISKNDYNQALDKLSVHLLYLLEFTLYQKNCFNLLFSNCYLTFCHNWNMAVLWPLASHLIPAPSLTNLQSLTPLYGETKYHYPVIIKEKIILTLSNMWDIWNRCQDTTVIVRRDCLQFCKKQRHIGIYS